jgi:hypothetical protein
MVERSPIQTGTSTEFQLEPQTERQRTAERDLAALSRERDLFHGLWYGLLAQGARHFSGADMQGSDPMERWGRRIGRALAMVAFAGFCLYLYLTYVR